MTNRLVLALDTATASGGVALGSGSEVLGEIILTEASRHSEAVLPAIEDLLRVAGASMRDVAAVVVGAGPGSFTGVRIAAATAKGLVRPGGAELHAFSSLLAAAWAAGAVTQPVCALFDARREEAYAGCWLGEEVLLSPTADHVSTIVQTLAGVAPLYVGDGAQRNRELIETAGGRVAAPHATEHCARALLALYDQANGAALVADAAHWQPTYIRPPNVTVPSGSGVSL